MAYLLDLMPDRQLDDNANAMAGAKLYVFAAGTTTPIATYTDSSGLTQHPHPIPAASNGFWPQIWVSSASHRLQARKADGTTVLWDRDNVRVPSAEIAAGLIDGSQTTTGAALIGIDQLLNYATPGTLAYMLKGARTLEGAGAWGDGTHDDVGYLTSALAAGGTWILTRTYRITSGVSVSLAGTTLLGFGGKIVHDSAVEETVLTAIGKDNVKFIGLEVDGKKSLKSSGGAVAAYGIDVADCDGFEVSGCYVHDCYEHGIRFGSKDDTATPKTTNGRIVNNYCKDNGNTANERGWGIWGIKKVDGVVIDGNVCMNNIAGGVMVDDTHNPVDGLGCDNVVITNNVVKSDRVAYGSNSRGIQLSGTNNFVVGDNRVTGYRMGIAITCGQAGTRTGSGNVSGNIVESNEYGILIDTVRRANIEDNQIFMTKAACIAGIDVINQALGESPMIDLQIIDNFILTTVIGVQCGRRSGHDTTINNLTICDNVIRHSGTSSSTHRGIDVNDAQGVKVGRNLVSSFWDNYFTDNSVTNVTVRDNEAVGADNYGYRMGGVTRFIGNVGRSNDVADLRSEAGFNNASTVLLGNNLDSGTAVSGSIASITKKDANVPVL